MKKVLCAVLLIVMCAGAVYADKIEAPSRAGALSRLNLSPEDYQVFWNTMGGVITMGAAGETVSYKFYDSINAMLMALNAKEIDTMYLPEIVGKYILRTNPNTESKGIKRMDDFVGLAIGFRRDNSELRNNVDSTLAKMTTDGTLSNLVKEYITDADADDPKAIEFEKFEDAETLKVAVTGDMPPIDYVAVNGTPAGFNTALLAEIGKRLRVNIETVQVDSGARAAALSSGRVDAVFWFEVLDGAGTQWDIPSGVIVTKPYYGWHNNMMIGLKK